MKYSNIFLVTIFSLFSVFAVAEVDEQPEVDIDQIVDFFGVEASETNLDKILDQKAEDLGGRVDHELISRDELDGQDPYSRIKYLPGFERTELGYTRNGMDEELPANITANTFTDKLYIKYNKWRSGVAVELPGEFSSLVRFVAGYIKENALKDAEAVNGMTHDKLAVQIVRASFCFGNDPFMVASKMRRETSFRRGSVSPTGAVGFSQMTGDGINEVKHQLSGNSKISMGNARSSFVTAIRCFAGAGPFNYPSGKSEAIKTRLQNSWAWDIIYGQIMVKTLVSYTKSSGSYPENPAGAVEAYREAFAKYNGDDNPTVGYCLKEKSVLMRLEYACSVIQHFQQMSAQWSRFIRTARGQRFT